MANASHPQDTPRYREGDKRRPPHQHLSIWNILTEGWALYTNFLGRFFFITLIVFAVLSLAQFATEATGEFGVLALYLIAVVAGTFFLQGALVVAVADARQQGTSLSIVDVFRQVMPFLWPLVGAGLLVAVGIAIGLAAFILPGLVVLAVSSMVAPAIVLERKPIVESFKRSWQLVRRDIFQVLAIVVITIFIATIFSAVLLGVMQPLPEALRLYVATALASAVAVPFITVTWAAMYFELKLNVDSPLVRR